MMTIHTNTYEPLDGQFHITQVMDCERCGHETDIGWDHPKTFTCEACGAVHTHYGRLIVNGEVAKRET